MKRDSSRFVTAKHPPNFERKMASHRAGRLGRFLFVRDAIRFRCVHGLVEDGAATKKRGVLGSYQKTRKYRSGPRTPKLAAVPHGLVGVEVKSQDASAGTRDARHLCRSCFR